MKTRWSMRFPNPNVNSYSNYKVKRTSCKQILACTCTKVQTESEARPIPPARFRNLKSGLIGTSNRLKPNVKAEDSEDWGVREWDRRARRTRALPAPQRCAWARVLLLLVRTRRVARAHRPRGFFTLPNACRNDAIPGVRYATRILVVPALPVSDGKEYF